MAAKDSTAVATAFTPDGVIVDVGREIRGREGDRPLGRQPGHRRCLHAARPHPAPGRRHHAGPRPAQRRGRLPLVSPTEACAAMPYDIDFYLDPARGGIPAGRGGGCSPRTGW
ncbi:hypothetical protein FHR32_007157 [Streptosporangium album]|uniref:Uncharacterized protein n=1 Tax=Streptosporangium album TaxID=47479 RepID=A0A7W7S3E8_9ACTN|nr:hypothetical protein [Streptosporangium album]MBB4942757.1 hypothetical protein [Streptosporangium album]